jgi:hypothetical protein
MFVPGVCSTGQMRSSRARGGRKKEHEGNKNEDDVHEKRKIIK